MSSIKANPYHLNYRINRNLFIYIAIFAGCLWLYSLFFVPTFDLDESLYRRVADEMKKSGEWWKPTWDGLALYHKPPIFYWIIALVSRVIDGADAPVSVFAARIPSFVASSAIVFSLLRFTHNFVAPALFLSAVFPLVTATSVIFDPIQTFLLLPTVLYPSGAFLSKRELNGEELLYMGLGMFGATAFKGLNGLILPAAAFGFHWLLFFNRENVKGWLRAVWRFTFIAFVPALVLSVLYYWVLDSNMGRPFTHEFFFIHHLGRSTGAMESHGGSFFYHPLVLFFCGGFLTPFLIYQWIRIRPDYRQYCFPATYTLTFLIAFGFSATKLPHYTWPVWPALALMGAILFQLSDRQNEKPVPQLVGLIASFPVFAMATLALMIVFGAPYVLDQMELSPRFEVLVQEFATLKAFSRLSLVACALICIAFQAKRSFFVRQPMYTSALAVAATALLGFGILPSATHLMVVPFEQIAKSVHEYKPKPTDCIRYAGPHSPTLSIALGREILHNRCEPGIAKFLIVPRWKEAECDERRMKILDTKSYLSLCGRNLDQ